MDGRVKIVVQHTHMQYLITYIYYIWAGKYSFEFLNHALCELSRGSPRTATGASRLSGLAASKRLAIYRLYSRASTYSGYSEYYTYLLLVLFPIFGSTLLNMTCVGINGASSGNANNLKMHPVWL